MNVLTFDEWSNIFYYLPVDIVGNFCLVNCYFNTVLNNPDADISFWKPYTLIGLNPTGVGPKGALTPFAWRNFARSVVKIMFLEPCVAVARACERGLFMLARRIVVENALDMSTVLQYEACGSPLRHAIQKRDLRFIEFLLSPRVGCHSQAVLESPSGPKSTTAKQLAAKSGDLDVMLLVVPRYA
jgi:hypothetical protein